ncbi:MAG: hypothetical protein ACU83N_01075 [Gammaproteobacteria bacterium]
MNNVIQFKKPKASEKHKGKLLCKSGFHQWEIIKEKQFDVQRGKLGTIYQCSRCQAIKTKWL